MLLLCYSCLGRWFRPKVTESPFFSPFFHRQFLSLLPKRQILRAYSFTLFFCFSWSLLILLSWESVLIYLRIWRQDRRPDERVRTVDTQSRFVRVSLTKYTCLDASISQKRHHDDGHAASRSLLAIEHRLDRRHVFPPPTLGPRRRRCAWPFR